MSHHKHAFKTTALAVLALSACAWAQAGCFTVYNGKNEVIYRSAQTPVDLSKPLHETQNQLPPGAHLVFSPNNDICMTEVNELPGAQSRRATNANMVTEQINLGSLVTVQ